MNQLKCVLTLAGISVAAFSLAACQIIASPLAGTTFNETKYGNIATAESRYDQREESLRYHDFGGGCPG